MASSYYWLLSSSKILGERLRRIKIGITHLLWNLSLLVNIKVISCHVHVTDCYQRSAHIYTNSTTLIGVVVLVIVAYVANIGWCTSCCLQVLNTLPKLTWVWCLLFRLSLVSQICFVVIAVCGQLTLRWISILVHIYTWIHLFGLLRSNCSSLGGSWIITLSRCSSHLMPFTLSWALDSIWLRVCTNLRDLIVCLTWCTISKGLANTKLLLKVLLGLLSYQFPSLWSASASHWRSTVDNVPRIITIGYGPIFLITWFICKSINHRLLSRTHLMRIHSWSHLSSTSVIFSVTGCNLIIFHWFCPLILTILQLNYLVTLTSILFWIVLHTLVAFNQILLLLAVQWWWILWSLWSTWSP